MNIIPNRAPRLLCIDPHTGNVRRYISRECLGQARIVHQSDTLEADLQHYRQFGAKLSHGANSAA